MEKNCNTCIRKPVCKYVEANDQLADTNKMYDMFEYLESNNIKDIFYEYAAKGCKHYVRQDVDFEKNRKKISEAIANLGWLLGDLNYLSKLKEKSLPQYVEQRIKIIEKYIENLAK